MVTAPRRYVDVMATTVQVIACNRQASGAQVDHPRRRRRGANTLVTCAYDVQKISLDDAMARDGG
jgi:hypothetical protein